MPSLSCACVRASACVVILFYPYFFQLNRPVLPPLITWHFTGMRVRSGYRIFHSPIYSIISLSLSAVCGRCYAAIVHHFIVFRRNTDSQSANVLTEVWIHFGKPNGSKHSTVPELDYATSSLSRSNDASLDIEFFKKFAVFLATVKNVVFLFP